MKENEVDFESIQRIFAQRDREKKAQNAQREFPTFEAVPPKTNLKLEPEYENMHAKNIKITSKGKQKAQNHKLVLAVGVVLAVAIGTMVVQNIPSSQPKEKTSIVYMDEKYTQSTEDSLEIENCDFSNLTIILRKSTSNAGQVIDAVDQELSELGVDSQTISSDDDMINLISNIKQNNSNREIIVINIDRVANKGNDDTVIMTNYSNSAKSSDVLAMAIHNANEDIYDISSVIRCGKKDLTNGKRTETSVEKMLKEAGHTDVACLTVAPNSSFLQSDINVNNLATSIAEGVIRLAAISTGERYDDLIRRVEFGDTISELALANDVSESYIKSTNRELLSCSNGNLQYDSAIIVSTIPQVLTSTVTVNNPTITTNPSDITTKVEYYTVQPNDTVSAISEKLNVNSSDLTIPSGNIDVIKVGDKIGYETTEGPILVTKSTEKSK